ncbi:hypothetical protein BSL78_20994 [Apostichopus japonicus]|uniref:Uncharacterized protein n=1 Tax=Stichopus japonicus TaxID=307972 RepID=A0A2G8K2C7_STIJA|nr:hypothetical protein BSL78_20994 [Apostichopus japonicus]
MHFAGRLFVHCCHLKREIKVKEEVYPCGTDFPSTSSGFSSGSQGGVGSIGGPLKGQDGWSKDSTMQEIKWTIARLQENAGDDLEIQLTSQTLIANLKKMTFWEHVRALPSLFDNGGLFYEIVSRDLGLKDGITACCRA